MLALRSNFTDKFGCIKISGFFLINQENPKFEQCSKPNPTREEKEPISGPKHFQMEIEI